MSGETPAVREALAVYVTEAPETERVLPGYRRTEVGVIPEDWEVVLLDSVAKRGSGHTPDKRRPEYWNGDIKWVSLKDTYRLDALYFDDTVEKITLAGVAHSSAVVHPAGTVILSRDAGVGKSAIIKEDMAVSQHFMAWHCGPKLNNHYLYYWLQAEKDEFERIAIGSTIKTVGLPYFRKLRIPLPARDEQRAIAAALSDVDALIAALDKLIAKKRAVTTATMQQLLTGKQRLPGFSGEWEVKRFGEIASPRRERIDPRKSDSHEFCIELEHVEPGTGQLLGSTSTGDQSSLKSVFQVGDVLFSKLRSYLRKYWLADRSGVCSTEFWVLSANHRLITPEFLFQIVGMDRFVEAASTAYGTHMPRADWNVVKNYEVAMPRLEEQTAIATVLSDMDAEIYALEARRDKTQQVKQGMMQELLTGRTRLV
jgi:type I restriction enzyme, S subunit